MLGEERHAGRKRGRKGRNKGGTKRDRKEGGKAPRDPVPMFHVQSFDRVNIAGRNLKACSSSGFPTP